MVVAHQVSCQLPPGVVDVENVDELLPDAKRHVVNEHLG